MRSRMVLLGPLLAMMRACATLTMSKTVPMMTKDQLKAMLGNPDLTIIDVRYGLDWTDSDMKVKGAVREDPTKVTSWAPKYPKDKLIVLYCA